MKFIDVLKFPIFVLAVLFLGTMFLPCLILDYARDEAIKIVKSVGEPTAADKEIYGYEY